MAEKKINGELYKVEPLMAKAALQLLAKMTKVGGAAWERVRQDIEKQSEANMGIVIVQFVVDIVRNNPTDEVIDLIEEIVGHAQCRRPSGAYDRVIMDLDFHGRLQDIQEVATFVLMENFGDFFGALGLAGKAATPRKAAA